MYKIICSFFFSAVLSLCFSLPAQTSEPSPRHIELSTRIDDLDKKIEEARKRVADLAIKRRRIIADSAAAVKKAGDHIAALSRTRGDLPAQVRNSENAISFLEQSLESFKSVITQKKTGLAAAGKRLHGIISSYSSEVAQRKRELVSAKKNRERVEQNGSRITKKNEQEMKRLSDSLERIDRNLAVVKRQIDSLDSARKKNSQDSLAAVKKKGTRFKETVKRLSELRTTIAKNDSMIAAGTDELNKLRKDSSALEARYQNGARNPDKNGKTLDSLALALQNGKTALLSFQELLELDATIAALTAELRGLQQGGASQQAIEGKQQQLATSTTKRDALMRDKEVADLSAAKAGKKSVQELNAEIATTLSAIDRRLDSAARARETVVRDNVFLEKEYKEKSKQYADYLAHLDNVISTTSRQMINDKACLPTLAQDSAKASAALRAAVSAGAKKQAPIIAAIAKKKKWQDGLKRMRDALAGPMAEREAVHKKDCAEVKDMVGRALQEQQRARSAYDSIAALQQKARDDSAAVAKEILDNMAQAKLSMEMKQEEITVAKGKHKELLELVKEAQEDSTAAAQEKRQQEVAYQQKLSDLQRQAIETESELKELEKQRAALRRQLAGK